MEPEPEKPDSFQSTPPGSLGKLRFFSPTIAFIIVSFSLGELVSTFESMGDGARKHRDIKPCTYVIFHLVSPMGSTVDFIDIFAQKIAFPSPTDFFHTLL